MQNTSDFGVRHTGSTAKPRLDYTGRRFGKLVILRHSPEVQRQGRPTWLCQCDCGGQTHRVGRTLTSGKVVDCGCGAADRISKGNTTHGASRKATRSPEYVTWSAMRHRCLNPNARCYENYGGRGIAICPEWDSFERFLSDMGPRPSADHSLDRIDNSGDYKPGNCRWATPKEQAANTRMNHRYSYQGKMLLALEIAEMAGVDYHLLRKRLRAGWNVERAVSEPSRSNLRKPAAK